MLMEIRCETVTSVAVHLVFDDGMTKDRVISKDDLIQVEYNKNGCRQSIEGKVIKISTNGTDPKGWYIMVDGSNDFDCEQARFSVASILDLEIIRKAGTVRNIESPLDATGIVGMRVLNGALQYTQDGFTWNSVMVPRKNIIMPESGTCPDSGDDFSSMDNGFCGGIIGESM